MMLLSEIDWRLDTEIMAVEKTSEFAVKDERLKVDSGRIGISVVDVSMLKESRFLPLF